MVFCVSCEGLFRQKGGTVAAYQTGGFPKSSSSLKPFECLDEKPCRKMNYVNRLERMPSSSVPQTQGGDLRKGGASDARYAIVVEEPKAQGEAAAAIAVASDVFREERGGTGFCQLSRLQHIVRGIFRE